MKLSKLINKLERLKEELGEDIDVVMQYRDDGGEYGGVDTELYLSVRNAEIYKDGHWVVKKTIIL